MSCEHEVRFTIKPTDDACRFHFDVRAYKDRIVAPDEYTGSTTVTPSDQTQVLETKDKLVREDITVNPAPTEVLSTDHNGTFTPSDGKVGFYQVDVDVNPDLRPLSVSENGTYEPDGFDGYSSVTVNNPAQWTTAGIANGTEPVGEIYLDGTDMKESAFSDCTGITKVFVENINKNINSAFMGCSNLEEAHIQYNAAGSMNRNSEFRACTNLKKAVVIDNGNSAFVNTFWKCSKLEIVDIDLQSTAKIDADFFTDDYSLTTLILRKTTAVTTLNKVTAFNRTPFRGYNGLSGTIYVPNALIDTYKTTGNWKTLYDEGHTTFVAIEGSPYEYYYADGTPIS